MLVVEVCVCVCVWREREREREKRGVWSQEQGLGKGLLWLPLFEIVEENAPLDPLIPA